MSERKEPNEPWTIVVVPLEDDEVPASVRVKRWLKAGLRGFRLKCVEVRTPTQDEVDRCKEVQP